MPLRAECTGALGVDVCATMPMEWCPAQVLHVAIQAAKEATAAAAAAGDATDRPTSAAAQPQDADTVEAQV